MRTVAELRLCFLFSILFAPLTLAASGGLTFEPNAGQTGPDIQYIARTSNGVIFITDRGIILSGTDQTVPAFELAGGDLHSQWQPEAANGKTITYFIGNDPSKWRQDIPRYERLVRRDVYPGIDLVLYGSDGQLEYDFELAPHADPSRIRLNLMDALCVSVNEGGTLLVDTAAGEIRHRKPILTEMLPDGSRRTIMGSFRITGLNQIGFAVDAHDSALPLSIDPVLESSTYFGGHGDDQVIATDGGSTLVGNTSSIDVPNAAFARRAGTSIFIELGSQTTVIGCTGNVTATAAALSSFYYDSTGAVVGYADCVDLPTNLPSRINGQPLSLQPNYGGGATDGFLLLFYTQGPQSSLSPNNISLSYIGGPGDDRVNAVALNGYVGIAGSTTEGGLPEPDYVSGIAGAPAGGLDAFVMLLDANQGLAPFVDATTYLGGSGDDTALGIAFSGSFVYVTGETKSPNFPLAKPLYSKRHGDSDAFVASLFLDGTLAVSTLFGGGGSDQSTAINVLPSGNIAIAGVTSSTDLPSKNATQKAYGGGASDAFLAQFTPDLATLVSSTYIGGSEADVATSVASAFPNTIFVGGWTASQNFPVVDALQPKYGGGPDDGFLVHFDDDGSIYEATFFGGSGSDHILGMTAGYPALQGPTVWLVGTTSSPDLPLQNPTQSGLLGSSDGFVAEVTANLFTVSPLTGGKYLRVAASFAFGNSKLGATTTFTVTSSHPSTVQVAIDTTTPGAETVEFQPTNSDFAGLYVDCLTDSGGANLTISAPVYGSKTIPVTCQPEAISFAWSNESYYQPNQPPNQAQTNIGSAFTISFSLAPAGPAKAGFYYYALTRPGAPPVVVEVSNSNPQVGTVSEPSVTLGGEFQNTTFAAQAIGSTELTFSAGGIQFVPSSTLNVAVGGSFNFPTPFAVPAGFEGAAYLSPASNNTPSVTITSKDPKRIALTLDPTQMGSGSLTTPPGYRGQIWVQALGSSGNSQLVFSVAGQPDVSTTVRITTPDVTLSDGQISAQPLLQLPLGGSGIIGVSVGGVDPGTNYQLQRNPGSSPITFTLHSSNSGVVDISPATTEILPGTYAKATLPYTATASGTTVLTVTNSANIPIAGPLRSATVNVSKTPVAIKFPDVEVGKNLIAQMTLTLPAVAKSDVVINASISDPTLALLSLDGSSPGLPQLTTLIPGGNEVAQFYVYALADSGQAKVTVDLPGYSPVTANVNLDRSGFYWSLDTLAAGIGPAAGITPEVLVGPLDAASGIPVGTQSLSPEVGGTVGVSSSNSSIVSVSPSQVPVSGSGAAPQITAQSPGSATLSLVQPPGFTPPTVRQKLAVTVSVAGPPTLSGGTLGKYLQTPLSMSGYTGNPTLTVTSSNPSKLVLSGDPGKRGGGKVTTQGTIYAQALSDNGTVMLTITAARYPKVTAIFHLIPVGFGITIDTSNYGATIQNGIYTTTTQSVALNVTVGLYLSPNSATSPSFVPGVGPFAVNITSSNTGVAVLTGSPITIPGASSSYGLGSATLLQVSPGQTTISVSQPPGFSPVGANQLTVQVVNPSLAGNNLMVAKDTLTASYIDLGQGLKPLSVDLPVTLTSSDPSRVLLSPDATTPPTASVTIPIPAGSNNGNFFVHALSDNGNVAIQVTASGFTTSPFTVQLFPLAFALISNASQSGPINAIIHGGPQNAIVSGGPLTPGGFTPYSSPLTLRPGVSAITLSVTSSNPSVVSVTPKIVFQGTISNSSVAFTPLKPGKVTLTLNVPSGYVIAPTEGQLSIVAVPAAITFNGGAFNGTSYQVGKDLQAPLYLFVQDAQPNASITLTSSDPSVLLVSADTTTPGQSSVVIPLSGFSQPTVYVQALAGSGSANLTATTPSNAPATLQVNFTPAGLIFQSTFSFEQNVLTNAGVQQETINLVALDPITLKPGQSQLPRPGANLSATVTSSDPKVVTIATPSVPIPPPTQPNGLNGPSPFVGIQPVGEGTAIVTLEPFAGNPAPASGNQLVVNVTEPGLSIPAITLGRDLEVPAQVTLGSAVPTPAADVQIRVNSDSTVALSSSPGVAGQSSLLVTIPAGQRVSNSFYVQGMTTGITALNYFIAGSSQTYSTPITVSQTAFVIQEAANGPLNLSTGTTSNLTVIPTLSPPSITPTGPWTIRAGANPIVISVASTNTSVATTTPSQVTFNPGDQKQVFTAQAVSAGNATITLFGSGYDFSQPQSSIQVTVK